MAEMMTAFKVTGRVEKCEETQRPATEKYKARVYRSVSIRTDGAFLTFLDLPEDLWRAFFAKVQPEEVITVWGRLGAGRDYGTLKPIVRGAVKGDGAEQAGGKKVAGEAKA